MNRRNNQTQVLKSKCTRTLKINKNQYLDQYQITTRAVRSRQTFFKNSTCDHRFQGNQRTESDTGQQRGVNESAQAKGLELVRHAGPIIDIGRLPEGSLEERGVSGSPSVIGSRPLAAEGKETKVVTLKPFLFFIIL